jgi:hypothetical protein
LTAWAFTSYKRRRSPPAGRLERTDRALAWLERNQILVLGLAGLLLVAGLLVRDLTGGKAGQRIELGDGARIEVLSPLPELLTGRWTT